MAREIENFPEVMVLKTGERITKEVADAFLVELHSLAQEQPIEFCNLTYLLRRNYHRAARRSLQRCYPQAKGNTVETMLAVLRAAVVHDGMATRLGSPYDLTASYQGTGGLYDQQLYQITRQIADTIYQASLDFGNKDQCTWMRDQREDTPNPRYERSCGLFLVMRGGEFPYILLTPWGKWRFADFTDYTRSSLLHKGDLDFATESTIELQLEEVSRQRHETVYAINAAFGEELPRAVILPELENAGDGQYRYITNVWQHAAEWLDPGRYF